MVSKACKNPSVTAILCLSCPKWWRAVTHSKRDSLSLPVSTHSLTLSLSLSHVIRPVSKLVRTQAHFGSLLTSECLPPCLPPCLSDGRGTCPLETIWFTPTEHHGIILCEIKTFHCPSPLQSVSQWGISFYLEEYPWSCVPNQSINQ